MLVGGAALAAPLFYDLWKRIDFCHKYGKINLETKKPRFL